MRRRLTAAALTATALAACTQTIVIEKQVGHTASASATSASMKTQLAERDVLRQRIEDAKGKVFPALVTIYAYPEVFSGGRRQKRGGIGSGTIIHKNGYVITNAHVTQSAKKYECMLSNKERVTATLVGEDYATDLAVLKLDLTETKEFGKNGVPVATFGKSSDLVAGDMVMAMGSPRGLTRTVTLGVIANPERQLTSGTGEGQQRLGRFRTGQYTNWLHHDATIHPGNSGGPLVDLNGRIIGINELGGNDMYFAIPSDIAAQVTDELMRHGRVIRSWLGFNCGTIEGTGEDRGILVLNVDNRSPAAKAGIEPGDIILSFDGTPVSARYVEELPPFYRMATETPIGKMISVRIKRDGKTRELKWSVAELASDWADEREFRGWGMTAADISPLLQRDARLASRDGIFVTGVRGLAADVSPSLQGKVITRVGDTVINNLDDLAEVYRPYAKRKDKYEIVIHYHDGVNSYLGVLKNRGEKDPDPQDVKRPWVGIDTQVFVTELRKALEIEKNYQGVRVTRIFPNTLVEDSDLQVGDLITHIEGKMVKASRENHTQVFPQMLLRHKIDESVTFTVRRGDDLSEKVDVEVTLEAAPLEPRYAKKTKDKDFEFGVRDITFYDIVGNRWPKETEGLIVTEVDPHGWASRKMGPGDLILSIHGQEARTIDEFKELMESIKEEQPERVKILLRRRNSTVVSFIEPEWEN